ncbi:MAG TPA: GNAT family N-acetyltransferase [Flavobacteriales bacterium]|nr:GNAT family N-acetyltransferase [Flavobacteriales bacterium]
MDYKLIECLDNNTWNEFVLTSPQNNLFCQTDFLDVYQQDYDLLLVTKGELILSGVVIIKGDDGAPVKNQFMYQGVLFSKHIESLSSHKKIKKVLELTQFLLIELESIYGVVSLSLHHSLDDLRGFQWHNYHNSKGLQPYLNLHYTGVLDLKKIGSFEQALMNVRTVRRQEYKKCIKNGFTVEASNDVSILNFLHEKTFERQGMKRSKSEVFLATELARESLKKGIGRLLICRNSEGVPTSASLFLFDNKTGYYLIGANDPEYRKFGTGGFVVLEQIRYCIEQGLSYVDFIGINSPLRGDFKTSFNANPTPYFTFSLG